MVERAGCSEQFSLLSRRWRDHKSVPAAVGAMSGRGVAWMGWQEIVRWHASHSKLRGAKPAWTMAGVINARAIVRGG